MRKALLFVCALALGGCTATPAPGQDADPVFRPSLARFAGSPSPSTVALTEDERGPSFPGGGRILYLPQTASGYLQGIGVVRSNGRDAVFPAPRGTFTYWDPGEEAAILAIETGSHRQTATSYRLKGGELRATDSWRLDDGNFAVFSRDGRWVAEPAFDERGQMKEDVTRVLDRGTGEVTSHRIGSTPIAWAGDRLLVAPFDRGDLVLWDVETNTMTPFLPATGPIASEIIWSPDLRTYATRVSLGNHGSRHAIAIGSSAGELTMVSRHGERWVETPTWSPDGERIAFIVRGPGRQGHRTADLFVYEVSTGARTLAASDVSDAFWVSWSPDGRWLLLDDWTRQRWLFVAADGGRQITYPELGSFPRWCCPSSPPIEVPIPVC